MTDRAYKRTKDVAWRRIGDETVVLHLGRKRVLGLNEAGGAVWDAIVLGSSMSGTQSSPPSPPAKDEPAGARDAGSPDDLGAFLAELEAEGLVEGSGEIPGFSGDSSMKLAPDRPPLIRWRESMTTVIQFSCLKFPGQCEPASQE